MPLLDFYLVSKSKHDSNIELSLYLHHGSAGHPEKVNKLTFSQSALAFRDIADNRNSGTAKLIRKAESFLGWERMCQLIYRCS